MNKITEILNILKELELKVAELYSSCSENFPNLKEFWSELESQEKKHSEHIQKMMEVYLQNPGDFIEARPFNISAVKTVIKGIEENTVSIENNKIDQLKALNIALDIEKSLLEAKFMEYLKTENSRYNNYMKGISGETFQHRKKIESKIRELETYRENLDALKKKIKSCCISCEKHNPDCMVQKMLDAVTQSIETGLIVNNEPEFTGLLEDPKKYNASGLDILQLEIDKLCSRCPEHQINCTINKCRKCLGLIQYGHIVPFRGETAEDIARIRGSALGNLLEPDDKTEGNRASASEERVEDDASSAAAVRTLNYIIRKALTLKASDIHLEPGVKELVCRMRIDGRLFSQAPVGKKDQASLLSRCKVIAGMDIAKKRIPQDGRFSINYENRRIDFRVSTFPSVYGEKIVMRIIDKDKTPIGLKELGLSEKDRDIFLESINLPNGIILMTGPTGSGKSSTIYAGLREINTPDVNIVTLEDPVEYNIGGVTQGQVNEKAGFTFKSGLRSILRQDPDIILVGEIRDMETAEISMQAAMTGHLVFSTLHTNSAAAAFMRLFDMRIEPFLISSSVQLVMAQRLVRVLCKNCRESYAPDSSILDRLGEEGSMLPEKIFRAKGCRECSGLGYKGRAGVFELLRVDDGIRHLIAEKASAEKILAEAIRKGMRSMRQDGIEKISAGVTSLEEVLRVT